MVSMACMHAVSRPIQFIRKQAFASDSSFISSTTARKEVQAADVQGRQLKPLTRTAYRRKQLTPEQVEARKEEERRRREESEQRVASLAARKGKGFPRPRAHVTMIDAYNVLFKCDELAPLFESGQEDDRWHARQQLVRRVDMYAAATGHTCITVFDAMGSGKNKDVEDWHSVHQMVVFATDSDADSWIINAALEADRQGSLVTVVTDDGRIQDAVFDLHGGKLDIFIRSSGDFLHDLETVRRGLGRPLLTANRVTNSSWPGPLIKRQLLAESSDGMQQVHAPGQTGAHVLHAPAVKGCSVASKVQATKELEAHLLNIVSDHSYKEAVSRHRLKRQRQHTAIPQRAEEEVFCSTGADESEGNAYAGGKFSALDGDPADAASSGVTNAQGQPAGGGNSQQLQLEQYGGMSEIRTPASGHSSGARSMKWMLKKKI